MASPSSSTEPAARPPLCASAPLLHSLLPLMAGIASAKAGGAWACLAAGLLILAWNAAAAFPRRDRLRPVLIHLLSLLAGALLFHRATPPPHPDWGWLPPREATVTLRIDEAFHARKAGAMAGIGTLLQTDIPHDTVRGRQVAFYLESGPLADQPPGLGMVVACRGVLSHLPAAEEHDDYQLYLLRRDIFLSLNRGRVLAIAAPAPAAERLRQRLYRASQRLLAGGATQAGDPGNVLASMLLGNRTLLTDARVELYRRTGTYHLFAVSGLHVGSVALCLHLLAGLLRLPPALRVLAALAGTWGYVWLTGASPSAMRAGIMITCISVARQLLRQPHLFPALVLSAWLVLLWQPRQLFDLGFQLSYAVVAAILLAGLPLAQRARACLPERQRRDRPLPRLRRLLHKAAAGTVDLACISLSASLGSMPLIVQHFSLFTPGGVILGILLNPLATLSVMAGAVALLLGPVLGGEWAGLLARATWPLIRLMEVLLELCLRVPGAVATRSWAWPPTGTCVLAVALAGAWVLQRARQGGRRLPDALLLLPHAIVLAGIALTKVGT